MIIDSLIVARSTSWRDGTDNGLSNELDRTNGTLQSSQGISSSPTGGGNGIPNNADGNSIKAPIAYKKSWDEESNLPEWATESFDYGGTFDASGAFHDSGRGGGVNVNMGNERNHVRENDKEHKQRVEMNMKKNETLENRKERIENHEPSPAKFMNFLNDNSPPPPPQEKPIPKVNDIANGPTPILHPAPIAQMDKMVENFVANLIMDDDTSTMNSVKVPPPAALIEWFYRDPQGDTQGPFSSGDMSEWYKAGYFQESLMVRRSIDNTFTPLGHLVKIFGASRPFITACTDGGPPIPLPEVVDPFRMRMQMPPQAPIAPVPPVQPDNWSLMTAEQRMFFMQLATHQPRPPVDPYVMKAPQQPTNPLDIRRLMGGDFFPPSQQQQVPQQAPPQQPQAPPPQQQQQTQQQPEPDPIHQLIMQLQMQQKTGGVDAAQWIKPSPQQPPEMPAAMVQQQAPPPQQQNSSSTHWSGTPMNIWDLGSGNKEQQHRQQSMHDVQMAQQQPLEPDILQNGNVDDSQHQMQKVESKKKKKEPNNVKEQQQPVQVAKEQPKDKKQQPQPVEKKKQEKKKEERTTQPAAPAPWVGHQNNVPGTSLTKIQKTEAQRRQVEIAAQKERDLKQQLEMMMSKQEIRDVKWNLQMPPAAQVKSLDEIQAEEQTAAEREERAAAKREKKEVVIVGDIWNTGAHSMAWQQPKAWSGGQSNSGFWEDPVKPPAQPKQPPQMLSKSQTMATISTAKKQIQQQQAQQQAQAAVVAQQKKQEIINKKRIEKKKDEINNEFTIWCTRTLSAMNGNVDSELKIENSKT